MYAQEPAYNDIDVEFLKILGVTVVHDGEGYNLITANSLAYTPGAEMFVEMQVLQKKPGVLLTGKLDWYWRNQKGQACTNRVSRDNEMVTFTDELKTSGETSIRDKKDGTRTNQRLEEECQVLETFVRAKQCASLPRFDYKDDPFHNQYLYWPRTPDDGEGVSADAPVE